MSLKFSENTVWIHLHFVLTNIYQSWKGQHCSNHMGFFVENGQNFKYGRSNFTQLILSFTGRLIVAFFEGLVSS